jgi:hypothetical protein
MPQCAAGMRTDPPPSLPNATGPMPLATDAPEPALDPPEVIAVSHGVAGGGRDRAVAHPAVTQLRHGRLASITASAARIRSTATSSESGTKSR